MIEWNTHPSIFSSEEDDAVVFIWVECDAFVARSCNEKNSKQLTLSWKCYDSFNHRSVMVRGQIDLVTEFCIGFWDKIIHFWVLASLVTKEWHQDLVWSDLVYTDCDLNHDQMISVTPYAVRHRIQKTRKSRSHKKFGYTQDNAL